MSNPTAICNVAVADIDTRHFATTKVKKGEPLTNPAVVYKAALGINPIVTYIDRDNKEKYVEKRKEEIREILKLSNRQIKTARGSENI
jgi:hypothetical protein